MSNDEQEIVITTIRKTQENIALVVGSILAVTLSVYFFTYAMVVDKGLMGILWIMIISSIVFVVVLFRLQVVAFFLARVLLFKRNGFKAVFAQLTANKD